MALRDVRRVHNSPRERTHIRPDDKYLPVAERRGHKQAPGVASRYGVTPRAHAGLHRACVGLLDGPRTLSVPG